MRHLACVLLFFLVGCNNAQQPVNSQTKTSPTPQERKHNNNIAWTPSGPVDARTGKPVDPNTGLPLNSDSSSPSNH